MMTASEIAGKLDAKHNGNGTYSAKCPAHDDKHASLSISAGHDGRVLLHCHAGCIAADILKKIGLAFADILPDDGRPVKSRTKAPSATRTPRVFGTANEAIKTLEKQHGPRAALWTYHDAGGEPIGAVVRWNLSDGDKDIRPVSRSGSSWIIGAMPRPRPLYHLPDLRDADPSTLIYVTEGERAAEAAISIGLSATTSAGGSQAARFTGWTPLAGRTVYVLPDNDTAGRHYANEVAGILQSLSPPAAVKIIELPGLAAGGDIVDWLPQFNGDKDAAFTELQRLVDAADVAPIKTASTEEEASSRTSPVLVNLADVTPEPIRWLWPNKIARGKFTLLAGDPGLGKSLISIDIMARTTTAKAWPDGATQEEAGSAIVLTAEDDLADTVRPRLDAAGADVRRVVALQAVEFRDKDGSTKRPFTLERDLPQLEAAIRSVENCRLVVIDPISAYLGGVDSHTNADIRGLLAPLSELAAQHSVAILGVNHLRKGDGSAIYRVMGSLAFVAAARAGFIVAKDREDVSGRRRLFLPAKNNLSEDASGLAYQTWRDEGLSAPYVRWLGAVQKDVDEALAIGDRRRGPEPVELEAATAWLTDILANGPVATTSIQEAAKSAGLSWRTVRRASEELKVKIHKSSFGGGWTWRLTRPPAEDGQTPLGINNLATFEKPGHLGLFVPKNEATEAGSEAEKSLSAEDGQVVNAKENLATFEEDTSFEDASGEEASL
jgi:putative DNA primase/helicase